MSANVNGICNKMISLQFNIEQLKPEIIILQETKQRRKARIKLPGYRVFELIRGDNGGGLLIACLSALEPVQIFEGNQECEVLVVEISVNKQKVRVIGGYGPQECAPVIVREQYRNCIEEQVEKAKLSNTMILIAEDSNAKLGKEWIDGDPHKICLLYTSPSPRDS